MQLTFENTITVGEGASPIAVHTKDNVLRVLYLDGNDTVQGLYASPDMGQYSDLVFNDAGRVSPDDDVSFPSIKRVAHGGAYGYWSGEGDHRLVVYFMPTDISRSLEDGSIQRSIGSDSASLSLNLVNIRGELLNRYRALVTPGTKISVYFSIGDTAETPLGVFYVDRASMSHPSESLSVTGRNAIGKLLKEQSFDENSSFDEGSLHDNLEAIMELAEVERYFCGDSGTDMKLDFDPDTTILEGLQYAIKLLSNWKIEETLDGVVGVAPANDARFDVPSVFEFERDKTCWEYNVDYDDADAAARVCVYAEGVEDTDPTVRVFVNVPFNKFWEQPSHRTLYVKTSDGATQQQCLTVATTLANSLSASGRLETFAGLFTPQLTLGDEVRVLKNGQTVETVGSVTDVTHNFGRGGFYTSFTVDSGGLKGRARLKDLIGTAAEYPEVFTGKTDRSKLKVELKNKATFYQMATTGISTSLSMMGGTLAIAVVAHTSTIGDTPSGWTLLHTSAGITGSLLEIEYAEYLSVFYQFTTAGSVTAEFEQESEDEMLIHMMSFSGSGTPTMAAEDVSESAGLIALGKSTADNVLWCLHRYPWPEDDKWSVTGVKTANVIQRAEGGSTVCIIDDTAQTTVTAKDTDGLADPTEYFGVKLPLAE